MAKKKKQTRKKKNQAPEPKEQSIVWPILWAIVAILIGILLTLGCFNTGGSLPVGLFNGFSWVFGWTTYFLPVILIYIGIVKLRHEEKRLPIGKTISVIALLFSLSAMFHIFTANTNIMTESGEESVAHGGFIGSLIGGAVLNFLDKIPAGILFVIVSLILIFITFSISIKSLFARRQSDDEGDTDLNDLKEKQFKLNEGVPTVHHGAGADEPKVKPRMSNLKNSAKKLTESESHMALTTTTDPNWKFPGLDLLNKTQDKADAGDVNANAAAIKDTFGNFNIDVEMEGANIGPRVTQYTMRPPTGVKLTKITALENNLALDLAATSIRIEAPIPGKRLVGIEVPNVKSATVRISSLLQGREWSAMADKPLSFVIGKDIAGHGVIADLGKMPHLLVAGQTGSGKSVMVNTILTSLLYRNSPSDLKLILVDPKKVEMAPYEDLPHLLTPVITEPEKCISALKWATAEMERRYSALAEVKKRNIEEYNNLKKEEGMPYIVIVIDELADLMMMAARDVEALIVRIAQKARAVGIHLILATQRPSVDVITGLIKANVPGRIAFTTQSQVDSRTIIDQVGAEKLLGRGDMLLLTSDMPKPKRIQAALIGDDETNKVCDFIRVQREPQYDDEVVSQPVQFNGKGGVVVEAANDADDDLWEDAVRVVIENRKASTSLLQRRLRVGYGRAARLVETMEEQGIVGQSEGSKPRDVLVSSMDEVFGRQTGGDVYDDMTDDEDEYLAK